jgi:phage shock protein PspC (stress-responsive transcriptional regulator)
MAVTKRLYRSRRSRLLGGVAGGLAEYFDFDPSLMRLFWIIAGIMLGGGVIAYIIAWIIIPEEPHSHNNFTD